MRIIMFRKVEYKLLEIKAAASYNSFCDLELSLSVGSFNNKMRALLLL